MSCKSRELITKSSETHHLSFIDGQSMTPARVWVPTPANSKLSTQTLPSPLDHDCRGEAGHWEDEKRQSNQPRRYTDWGLKNPLGLWSNLPRWPVQPNCGREQASPCLDNQHNRAHLKGQGGCQWVCKLTPNSKALSTSRQTNVVLWRDVAPLTPFMLLDCWWRSFERSTRQCTWPSWTWRKHFSVAEATWRPRGVRKVGPTTVPLHFKHGQMPSRDITKLQHQVEEDSAIQITRVPGHIRWRHHLGHTRINAAWLKLRQVTGVLCDKMPEYLKAKVYKTVVCPVTEMKMLRWMPELTLHDHIRNEDVRVAAISEKIREARLRWYGQSMCSDEDFVARTTLRLDPGGRRPWGRPKKRWMTPSWRTWERWA